MNAHDGIQGQENQDPAASSNQSSDTSSPDNNNSNTSTGNPVTRQGIAADAPSGREARVSGTSTGAASRRRDRGGREQRMVPPAEFESYYGKPVLNKPTWEARDIAGYLFLGGLAGASSVIGAGAQATGRPGLARTAKTGSAVAAGLSLAALVHDLGRPARFINMLRVFKPTSPMSVGSWILAGFAPLSGVAALSSLTGRGRGLGTAATAGAAVLGPAVATYTAALISDTAVPAWHDGHREMPFVFASSATAAACGLGLLAAPADETEPARRLAVVAAAVELGSSKAMRQRMGLAAECYENGRAGRLNQAAEALTSFGLAAAATGRRFPLVRRAAGLALLAGSALTRFAIFEAGVASAEDPKYTVVPQRERLTEATGAK
jgi:formate-dependent nitrite reductase membrane component NrfD